MNDILHYTCPKYMALVDAIIDLPFPDPPPSKFVTVSSFIEKNVTHLELEGLRLYFRNANLFNSVQHDAAALNIGHTQVGHFNKVWIVLPLAVLGDTSDNFGNISQPCPPPSHWQCRKVTVIDIGRLNGNRNTVCVTKPTPYALSGDLL